MGRLTGTLTGNVGKKARIGVPEFVNLAGLREK